MVHKRNKGNRIERLAVKELEDDGWKVYRVKGSTKFNKNVDIFGLFDILAIKKVINNTLYKFIQVKSNKKPTLEPFKAFVNEYQDDYNLFEIWVKKDGIKLFYKYKL